MWFLFRLQLWLYNYNTAAQFAIKWVVPVAKKQKLVFCFAVTGRCGYFGVFPYSVHGGLPAQGTEVCSHVACSCLCKRCQVHTGTHRHPLTQDRQDGLSLLQGWSSDYNLWERRTLRDLTTHVHISAPTHRPGHLFYIKVKKVHLAL